jgi:predicted small metal-binding protein
MSETTAIMKIIQCECGYVIRGRDDDELVARAMHHMAENHPDMAGRVSRDDLLAMANVGVVTREDVLRRKEEEEEAFPSRVRSRLGRLFSRR